MGEYITGLSKNVIGVETSYQRLEVLWFCDRERDQQVKNKYNRAFWDVYSVRIDEKIQVNTRPCNSPCPHIQRSLLSIAFHTDVHRVSSRRIVWRAKNMSVTTWFCGFTVGGYIMNINMSKMTKMLGYLLFVVLFSVSMTSLERIKKNSKLGNMHQKKTMHLWLFGSSC